MHKVLLVDDEYMITEGLKVLIPFETVSYTHLDVYKRQDVI